MAREKLILNRYKPLAEAGSGGFGTVIVAWDIRIQRKVAIKTIQLSEGQAARAAMPGADAVDQVDSSLTEETGYEPVEEYPEEDVPYGEDAVDSYDDYDGQTYDDEVDPDYDYSQTSSIYSHSRRPAVRARNTATRLFSRNPNDEKDVQVVQANVRALAHIPGLDEARTAAMLTDSNIVTVYDFEVRGTTAYLIMEYVEGITLTQLLALYGDYLTLDMVASIFNGISHALEVAHRKRVLHLDIKPDNVLIDKEGTVKVTDFGLATLADAQGYGTTGGGTIGYMPPEQVLEQDLDARTDEWALASVTYEILRGQNPFITSDLNHAAAAIENAELVLPSLCWDNLDEEADDVLFYALDPNPENRYDSVKDFAEEMDKFLGNARRGKRDLSQIVLYALGEVPEEETGDLFADDVPPTVESDESKGAFLDRMAEKNWGMIVSRIVGAIGSAFLANLALSNLASVPMLNDFFTITNIVVWVLTVLVGALGAWKPHLGALVSLLLLSVTFFFANAPFVAIFLITVTAIWWAFLGKKTRSGPNATLATPLAGSIRLTACLPLILGMFTRPVKTLGQTAFTIALAFVLACLGSANLWGWSPFMSWHFMDSDIQGTAMNILGAPGVYVTAVSWLLAGLVQSLFSRRDSFAFDVIGIIGGTICLFAGACINVYISSGQTTFSPPFGTTAVIILVALSAFVIAYLRNRLSFDD
ncbi:MAG: serine/threonine-protein kinase [Eggerthellaceae bacterium]|jgi:serine/threonine protein kinase